MAFNFPFIASLAGMLGTGLLNLGEWLMANFAGTIADRKAWLAGRYPQVSSTAINQGYNMLNRAWQAGQLIEQGNLPTNVQIPPGAPMTPGNNYRTAIVYVYDQNWIDAETGQTIDYHLSGELILHSPNILSLSDLRAEVVRVVSERPPEFGSGDPGQPMSLTDFTLYVGSLARA